MMYSVVPISQFSGYETYNASWDRYAYMLDRKSFAIPIVYNQRAPLHDPSYICVDIFFKNCAVLIVNDEKYALEYLFTDQEKLVLANKKICNIVFFSDSNFLYHTPITLVLTGKNSKEIEIPPVENKYLQRETYDLYDLNIKNIQKISFKQNDKLVKVKPMINIFYT